MSLVEFIIYFTIGACGLLYFLRTRSRKINYPPGPWGFPILGHLPLLASNPQEKCMFWAKKYGPIFSINFGQMPAVILNDIHLIRMAFNNNDFAGRPEVQLFLERSGGVVEGVIFTSGKKWMEQRKFVIRTLRDFGIKKNSMEGIFLEEIKDLIESFKKNIGKPVSTQYRFHAAVLNVLWTLIAGERFKQDDPELQIAIKHLTSNVQDNNPVTNLGNFIPILTKIAPKLSGFEKIIKDIFPILDFLRKPIEQHKSTFQPGQQRDFIDAYLEEIQNCTDSTSSFYKKNGEKSILFTIFDLFMAGGETTSTTLAWTFLYLAKYQQVQEKLYIEIKRIIGNSRYPSLTDRPNMPYTEAVILEILRFSALAPLGVLHSTVNDVEFGGYTIPKNTMIMANIYAVHYDKQIWGDPYNFRPERFLNIDGEFVKHECVVAFSIGKRVCLGENLARDELFLFIVSLFQTFHVAPATSTEELSIKPNISIVLSPLPHKLILTERN